MTIVVLDYNRCIHYGDRRAPWVRLYRKLFQDWRFRALSVEHRLLYLGLLTLAEARPDGNGDVAGPVERIELDLHLNPEVVGPGLTALAEAKLIEYEP